MRFKVSAAEIIRALNTVNSVSPAKLTPQGDVGYLFEPYCLSDTGEWRCRVSSRDRNMVARVDIKLISLEGEPKSFIAPASPKSNLLGGVRFIKDDDLDFEVASDGTFKVVYTSSSGGGMDTTSFDPKFIKPLDDDYKNPTHTMTFPVGILREALSLSKKFLPDEKDPPPFLKTVRIFDDSNEAWAKGNGNLFSTNATKAFWFLSEAFEGKGIVIHSDHLDQVVSFLSKCAGEVEVRRCAKMMYAVSVTHDKDGKVESEMVFGWSHVNETHSKFSFMPLKMEKYIFVISKTTLLNALNYTREMLEPNRDKIRITYKDEALTFSVGEGVMKGNAFPVPVEFSSTEPSLKEPFEYHLNINQLIGLIEDVKGNEVTFRVAPIPVDERRPKGGAMFRTIDEFWMNPDGKVVGGSGMVKDADGNEKRPSKDAFKCRVTRFMPSKD